MTNPLNSLSATATARLAGLGYLILAICGGFAHFGVRQRLVVPGDAAATAQNLLANAQLFRFGIVLELLGQVVFIFLVFALYDLLKVVHRKRAVTMVTLVVIAVTVTCLNMVNQAAALLVLDGGAWTAAFDPAQREALSLFFMELHHVGYSVVAQVFFGLWLVPLGVLIWASGFIPRIIGGLLVLAGAGYLVDVVLVAMLPSVTFVLSEFTFVGELLLMGWLLVRGVNAPAWTERAARTRAALA
jgi:hypothetical protein